MQLFQNISKSGVAKTMALAFVLASTVAGTAFTHADLDMTQTHNFTVQVFEGDPSQNKPLAGIPILLVADDRTNPSHGRTGTTDSTGTFVFTAVNEGGFNVEVGHNLPNYKGADYHVIIDSDMTLVASLTPVAASQTPTTSTAPTAGSAPAQASYGPQYNFTVKVYDGDPAQNKFIPNIPILLVADDRTNPSHGTTGTTDANGTAYFPNVYGGGFNVEIGHNLTDWYGRDYHVILDADTTLEASLISKTTPTTTNPPPADGACLPTPPDGKPMLNIWPISESGAPCTDYHFLAVKNATTSSTFTTGGGTVSATTGQIVTVELYIHNGTLDFPENIAHNVMVSASLPSGSGAITSKAWADNADLITSAQKGGDVNVSLGANQKLQFVSGSTKLYDNTGAFKTNLPDGIVGSGVSIGDMRGCYQFLHFVSFQAQVVSTSNPTPTPTPTPTPIPTPTPTPTPMLSIQKTVRDVTTNQTTFAKSITANPGDQVEFKISVSSSSATANNVVLTDVLPAELGFVDGSAKLDGTAVTPHNSGVALGNLAAGQTRTIIFRADIGGTSLNIGQTTITNTAKATSDNAASVQDSATIVVNKAATNPVISIQKLVRDVTTGQTAFVKSTNANTTDTVEYKIVVSATQATANTVTLVDSVPQNLSFVGGSLTVDGTNLSGDPSTIALGNMAAGSSHTIIFREQLAQANSFGFGQTALTNTATAFGTNTNTVSDSASVVVTRNIVNNNTTLAISKTVSNLSSGSAYQDNVSASVGNEVNYRIVVTNTGSIIANNVTVSDFLPTGISYDNSLSVTGSSFTGNINTAPFISFISLAPGQSVTIAFNGNVNSAACNNTSVNTAFASASNAPQVSDTASVTVNCSIINPVPNVNFSKKAWNDTLNQDATLSSAKAGDIITFTLTAQNTGNATFSNFSFTDNVSNVLQLASIIDQDGATLNNGVLTFPATDIPAGATINRGFRVQIHSSLPTSGTCAITNTFGNTVVVNVSGCTATPFVAPKTGATTTASTALAVVTVLGFALYRKDKFASLARLTGFIA